MSAFDPTPGAPYGECVTCGITIETEADSREHMSASMDDARSRGKSSSHRIRITNPPRVDRIRRRVRSIVESEIEDAKERVMEGVDCIRDVTEDELADALRWSDDYSLDLDDARREWVAS